MSAGHPLPPGRLAALVEAPDAAHWAHECGWQPGTGRCRRCDCADACVFREGLKAEIGRLQRRRMRRRAAHGAFPDRGARR